MLGCFLLRKRCFDGVYIYILNGRLAEQLLNRIRFIVSNCPVPTSFAL